MDSAPGRRQIQDNYLTPSDFVPFGGVAAPKSSDPAGDAALLGYINELYANQGANQFIPGTSYLVLRLNPDTGGEAGTKRYTVASADSATPAVSLPTLTLDVVPEPGTGAMLLLGTAVVVTRRRIKATP